MPIKDPVARAAYLKAQYAKNKEAKLAYDKEYRAKNKEHIKARKAKAHIENKDINNAISKQYHIDNKEKLALYRETNIEKIREADRLQAAKSRIKNAEKIKAAKIIYSRSSKGKSLINAAVARRKAAKLKRTPTWLSDLDKWMIDETYLLSALRTELTGVDWHVDHIIPLQGKLVSGLHMPYNLQVITAKENIVKGNRMEV